MSVENGFAKLVIYVAIGALWLAACGDSPRLGTPAPPMTTVEETKPAPPTAGAVPTTSVAATATPLPAPSATAPPTQTLIPSTAPPTGEPLYKERSGPTSLLASYYNAINRREYARAWAYWENPPDHSFQEFAGGFTDTESVLLVVRPPTRAEGAGGSLYVAMPTLLSATHTDGSHHNCVGCLVARRPNISGPGVEQTWSLYDAMVQHAPGNTTDVMVLAHACAGR